MNPFTGFCALVFTVLAPLITIAGLCVLVGATGPVGLWFGAVLLTAIVALWQRRSP